MPRKKADPATPAAPAAEAPKRKPSALKGKPQQGRPSTGGLAKSREAQVIELRVAGLKTSEIADRIKASRGAVHNTLTRPHVAEAIAKANQAILDDVRAIRSATVVEAMETVRLMMRGDPTEQGIPTVSGEVRLKAALEVLKMTGMGAAEKVEVSGPEGQPIQTTITHELRSELASMDLHQLRALAGLTEPEDG